MFGGEDLQILTLPRIPPLHSFLSVTNHPAILYVLPISFSLLCSKSFALEGQVDNFLCAPNITAYIADPRVHLLPSMTVSSTFLRRMPAAVGFPPMDALSRAWQSVASHSLRALVLLSLTFDLQHLHSHLWFIKVASCCVLAKACLTVYLGTFLLLFGSLSQLSLLKSI